MWGAVGSISFAAASSSSAWTRHASRIFLMSSNVMLTPVLRRSQVIVVHHHSISTPLGPHALPVYPPGVSATVSPVVNVAGPPDSLVASLQAQHRVLSKTDAD